MPAFLRDFHLDRLSFWLGFLAATLFWWLIRYLRGYWPQVKTTVQAQVKAMRFRGNVVVDQRLRREILRYAQGAHLSSMLFSLDEILIEPRLIAPPPRIEPEAPPPPENAAASAVPYLPDWPEVAAQFGAPTLSLPQALQGGARIAVIGAPGSGKTVALAHLASLLARRHAKAGELAELFPIYLHVHNLVLEEEGRKDLLSPIIGALGMYAPMLILPQVPGFVRSVVNQDQALLLLDGLDELPPPQLLDVSDYLARLTKAFPRLRVILAGSSEYLDGLAAAGFVPLAVAPLSERQRKEFISRWGKLWERLIIPDILNKEGEKPVESAILNRWMTTDRQPLSPLELTLDLWSLYAGDVRGPASVDGIEAYLQRLLPNSKKRSALERLALQMTLAAQSCVNPANFASLLADLEHTDAREGEALLSSESQAGPQPDETPEASSSGKEALRRINRIPESNGLIVEYSGGRIGFVHPVIAGYLAGKALSDANSLQTLVLQSGWVGKSTALHYRSVWEESTTIINLLLLDDDELLYKELFLAARWLKDGPPGARWRIPIMRQLLEILQREDLPLGARGRALAAFALSNDPSVSTLFRQLLGAPSAAVRQLAALGCGMIQDGQALNPLVALLSDPVTPVRQAACLALVNLGAPNAIQTLQESLLQGDEILRGAAAEALANHPETGQQILQEYWTSEDLLTRRAVVSGLSQVSAPWSVEILEKMRIEDGQWVVRNAASQALEELQGPNPYIPHPLPPPSQSPWLITFASKGGSGIVAGDLAIEMLLSALQSGTEEERIAALDYLCLYPRENTLKAMLAALSTSEGRLRERAYAALWLATLSGAKLPAFQMPV